VCDNHYIKILLIKWNEIKKNYVVHFTGSLNAACKLVQQCSANVSGCLVIMELEGLKGRDKVNFPVHSLLKF